MFVRQGERGLASPETGLHHAGVMPDLPSIVAAGTQLPETRMKISASLCLIGACLAPVCFAAEPPTFDPIVVTPSGTDTPWSDTLASVTVITREEIEHAQAGDV